MKRILPCLFAFCLFVQDHACRASDIHFADSLQGTWRCIHSVYDDPFINPDEGPPYFLDKPETMQIEKGMLYEFHFPCELVHARKFRLQEKDLFFIQEGADKPGSAPPQPFFALRDFDTVHLSFRHDTLRFFTGRYGAYYTERLFVHTVLDSAGLSWLRSGGLNPACLTGTWILDTTYDTGYDGSGILPYEFPFRPQKKLVITESNINKLFLPGRVILLKADGKLRQFSITRIDNGGTYMEVDTMDSWCPEEKRFVLIYRKQIKEE